MGLLLVSCILMIEHEPIFLPAFHVQRQLLLPALGLEGPASAGIRVERVGPRAQDPRPSSIKDNEGSELQTHRLESGELRTVVSSETKDIEVGDAALPEVVFKAGARCLALSKNPL
jgi:hypothetical protein